MNVVFINEFLIDFLRQISGSLDVLWLNVVLHMHYLEWVIAMPLILNPILRLVDFVYEQIDEEGGGL